MQPLRGKLQVRTNVNYSSFRTLLQIAGIQSSLAPRSISRPRRDSIFLSEYLLRRFSAVLQIDVDRFVPGNGRDVRIYLPIQVGWKQLPGLRQKLFQVGGV